MRRLLLNTHTLLWWLADDPQLGANTRDILADGRNSLFVSAASAWEISIKKALGRLGAPEGLDAIVEEEGFEKLAISFFHAEKSGELPPLHRDPFDRILVAQAQAEGLDIVTKDESIPRYGVKTLDASD